MPKKKFRKWESINRKQYRLAWNYEKQLYGNGKKVEYGCRRHNENDYKKKYDNFYDLT